jgi:hypothetical protein
LENIQKIITLDNINDICYYIRMIGSFKDVEVQKIWERQFSHKLPIEIQRTAL